MCRFLVIVGKSNKDTILNYLFHTEHSLFKQCYKNGLYEVRNISYTVNMDGYGIGWFYNKKTLMYKNIIQPWNDMNLIDILEIIDTDIFIAHIRANPPLNKNFTNINPVNYYNSHPFRYNEWLFCHNGIIGGFNESVNKRKIINMIKDNFLEEIKGTTDSEYLFYIILSKYDNKNIQKAIIDTINELNILDYEHNINICLTNNNETIVLRYNNKDDINPPSLYMKKKNETIIISSEPVDDIIEWKMIEKNTMIYITPSKITHVII
jgi:predicted glutamine amidotransferase